MYSGRALPGAPVFLLATLLACAPDPGGPDARPDALYDLGRSSEGFYGVVFQDDGESAFLGMAYTACKLDVRDADVQAEYFDLVDSRAWALDVRGAAVLLSDDERLIIASDRDSVLTGRFDHAASVEVPGLITGGLDGGEVVALRSAGGRCKLTWLQQDDGGGDAWNDHMEVNLPDAACVTSTYYGGGVQGVRLHVDPFTGNAAVRGRSDTVIVRAEDGGEVRLPYAAQDLRWGRERHELLILQPDGQVARLTGHGRLLDELPLDHVPQMLRPVEGTGTWVTATETRAGHLELRLVHDGTGETLDLREVSGERLIALDAASRGGAVAVVSDEELRFLEVAR